MTDAPEDASHGSLEEIALPADYGRDRNYMVGIGRVPHSEKKPNGNDREKSQHRIISCLSLRPGWADRQGSP
jgi:hypothetical protein